MLNNYRSIDCIINGKGYSAYLCRFALFFLAIEGVNLLRRRFPCINATSETILQQFYRNTVDAISGLSDGDFGFVGDCHRQ